MNTSTPRRTDDWGADFFGTINEMPPEPISLIIQILEAMGTEPGFRGARQTLLRELGLAQGATILEAGCGTGTSLPDIQAVIGSEGRVTGIDPTVAFIDAARRRVVTCPYQNETYEIGDIRALSAADNSFDAAFCDKVLIHAGPASVALGELARVTRPGGAVGALEWLPFFAVSSRRPELVARYNGLFRQAVYDYEVSSNLARHLHAAGLTDVRSQAFLAYASSLDEHPFWRAFLIDQMPLFVHVGLLTAEEAEGLCSDFLELDALGEFNASFVIQVAVGRKPA
ncbi:MAG TPA: methyltransferase domain-containing protein [Dehalococcoidia bacterium]|nr:methyltransferase domain-containing protein [Dehalococcoidia bacterium]